MADSKSYSQIVEGSEEEDQSAGLSETSYDEEKLESATITTKRTTRRKQVVDVACIGLNVASTVILVFLNKW